jgi:glycosyltransferase involved in cell wall biosynthesis
MPRVALLLDKINKPNNGLCRVSIDFSRALEQSDTANDLELNYIVYGNKNIEYISDKKIKRLKLYNKFIPAFYGKYDIIHKLHQSPAFKIRGAKRTILTIHDLNFLFTKTRIKAIRYLEKVQRNVDKADALVFISGFTRDICFKHLKIDPRQITRVIYNGISLPGIDPQRPGYIIHNEPFLFSIGQFLAKKNFHVLIPFLSSFPEKTRLIIAGENNTTYGSYVRQVVSEYKMENSVVMPGPVSEAEKLYLYKNCMAFVFPSLAEGFGLPVVEAMRAGKPVFCSDQTSLKEIADKHAYFWTSFEPDDMMNVFTNGIKDFNEDRKNEAYNYSLRFTWEKNAGEYLNLYRQLLEL